MLSASFLQEISNWVRHSAGTGLARTCFVATAAMAFWYSVDVFDRLQAFLFYEAGKYQLLVPNIARATDDLQQAVEYDSGQNVISRRRAYTTLSHAVIRAGENPDAILRDALAEFPSDADLRATWGAVLSMRSDPIPRARGSGAIRRARESVGQGDSRQTFDVFMPKVHQYIGEGRNRRGEHVQVLQASEEALKYAANPRAYYNMGVAHFHLSQYDEALNAYRNVAQLDPEIPEVYSNTGLVLARLGRHREALESYEKSIELNPELPDTHYNMGLLLVQLGAHQPAIAAFGKTVQLTPGDADAHYRLGLAYREAGDLSAARVQHDRLKDLDRRLADALLSTLEQAAKSSGQ